MERNGIEREREIEREDEDKKKKRKAITKKLTFKKKVMR